MKTGIQATVIADSISTTGARLTTIEATFPRLYLSQVGTHRVFSKNAASTRALPSNAILQQVEQSPYIPKKWGAEMRGMVARDVIPSGLDGRATATWLHARDEAVKCARRLMEFGVHHQQVNHLLTPWMWQTVLISSTTWSNFFALRIHADASEEMCELATKMRDALNASVPVERAPGNGIESWHLPYVTDEERDNPEFPPSQVVCASVGRCARVSYLRHDGTRDMARDVELALRLCNDGHWSPFEHQATPIGNSVVTSASLLRCGNFTGWAQYRKSFKGESR